MYQPLDYDTLKQIGHEARRPLVSLINTADLLLTGLEGELEAKVCGDIEAIRRNAEDALSSVDQLVIYLSEFARSTANKD